MKFKRLLWELQNKYILKKENNNLIMLNNLSHINILTNDCIT